MLTQNQLVDYFGIIGVQVNFALYQDYYQSWLDYLNNIVIPSLNPATNSIRLVGMESSPANPANLAVMSPNYIFNPANLHNPINGGVDQYIYQIYAGHFGAPPAGLTRHEALVALAAQPNPVILFDIYHTDGINLSIHNRRVLLANALAAAPPVFAATRSMKIGICDRLINIHAAVKSVVPAITLTDYRMIFATPPLTCTPNLVAEINSCGILNTFPPTVNTVGGGVAPSAPEIIARIAVGY